VQYEINLVWWYQVLFATNLQFWGYGWDTIIFFHNFCSNSKHTIKKTSNGEVGRNPVKIRQVFKIINELINYLLCTNSGLIDSHRKFCGFSHGKTWRNPFVVPPQPPASALGCPWPQFRFLEETPPNQSNAPLASFASDVNIVLLSMPEQTHKLEYNMQNKIWGNIMPKAPMKSVTMSLSNAFSNDAKFMFLSLHISWASLAVAYILCE
jgi:hypothetical protein